MSNDPSTNPITYDWNKVLISYCDGASSLATTTLCSRCCVPLATRDPHPSHTHTHTSTLEHTHKHTHTHTH